MTDAGELQSLTALGITSISLVGSGNTGESIAGSAVVNRTSYTTSAGTVGEVASVDLAMDTTGDVITTATGGAGNTVFLVNAKTVVHGGTGFNIVPTLCAIAMLPRRCNHRGGGKHRARSSSAPSSQLRGTDGKAGNAVAR